MGLALQIIGVIILIASLFFGIMAIKTKTQGEIAVALLIIGGTLIRLGRKM